MLVQPVSRDKTKIAGQYANNRVERDHGRLKAGLGPMRGIKTDRTASVVICGQAFIQRNLTPGGRRAQPSQNNKGPQYP
jgi:transposase-like protein